jgi:oxygen-independent coproporphyrinogen-3 oxidase
VFRYSKPANPRLYQETMRARGPAVAGDVVAAGDLAFEFMLNTLRLTEGFSAAAFEQRTGQPIGRIAGPLARAVARGLLDRDGPDRWRPTALGFRFLNDLQAEFLPSGPGVAADAVGDGRQNFMHTGRSEA